MNTLQKFFGAVLCACAVLVATQAASAEPDRAALRVAIQPFLDAALKRSGAPGLTAAVAMPDGDVLEFAAGLSDVERGFAMRPDDRMAAGSIGKTFVAALALALVTEGVVSLDDRIEKQLGRQPWFAEVPEGKDITLRMLLNHTAGLREWYLNLPPEMTREQLLSLFDPARPRIDVLRYAFRSPLEHPPGARYEYADSNVMLASLVLEAAMGRDYNEEIVRRFIYPLRLRHTSPSLTTMEAGLVQGYFLDDEGPLAKYFSRDGRGPFMTIPGVQPVNPRFEGAGGGFTTNAHDLAVWAKTLYENRAFPGDYLGIALAAVGPQNDESRAIGPAAPGMFVWDPEKGYTMASRVSGLQYGHLGIYGGYSATMMYFPQSKIAIAMMFNARTSREIRHALPTELADLVVTALRQDQSVRRP